MAIGFRILTTFIIIGLLTVGIFTIGENGHKKSAQEKETKTSIKNAEDVNKTPSSALEDLVYSIDKNDSHLFVRLFKAGIASAFAHDHVIRASDFSGDVVFKKDHPELFKMEVAVLSSSLIADSPKDRERYNMSSLDEDDRNEINETMKSSRQMHVEKYPKISFRSTKLKKTDTNNYTLTGDFTLRGTTKEIAVPVTITFDKNVLNIKGEFRFLQSDYGIEPFSSGWGAVRNKDEAVLIFDLRSADKK